MFEFDSYDMYKLISTTNERMNHHVNHTFYVEIIHEYNLLTCRDTENHIGGFITSDVKSCEENNGMIEVKTKNSTYIFEKIENILL